MTFLVSALNQEKGPSPWLRNFKLREGSFLDLLGTQHSNILENIVRMFTAARPHSAQSKLIGSTQIVNWEYTIRTQTYNYIYICY